MTVRGEMGGEWDAAVALEEDAVEAEEAVDQGYGVGPIPGCPPKAGAPATRVPLFSDESDEVNRHWGLLEEFAGPRRPSTMSSRPSTSAIARGATRASPSAENGGVVRPSTSSSGRRPVMPTPIPNVIHFACGAAEGEYFGLVRYAAVRSAAVLNEGAKVFVYYEHEPRSSLEAQEGAARSQDAALERVEDGILFMNFDEQGGEGGRGGEVDWWREVGMVEGVERVQVTFPPDAHGVPLADPRHRAQLFILRKLLEVGGAALTMDTLSLRPLSDLLRRNCVLGCGHDGTSSNVGRAGIGGAEEEASAMTMAMTSLRRATGVALAEPGCRFLRLWLDAFRVVFVEEEDLIAGNDGLSDWGFSDGEEDGGDGLDESMEGMLPPDELTRLWESHPLDLYRLHPESATLLPPAVFEPLHWASMYTSGFTKAGKRGAERAVRMSHTVRLWESHFANLLAAVDLGFVRDRDCALSAWLRRCLPADMLHRLEDAAAPILSSPRLPDSRPGSRADSSGSGSEGGRNSDRKSRGRRGKRPTT